MWLAISIFSILLFLVVALQFPQVQTFITGKITNFLSDKLQTVVEVGEVNIAFPKSVLVKDIYVEDRNQDTLLFAHRIEVDVDMIGLLSNKLEVNYLGLEGITGHVKRSLPDSTFNFDFIIEAFAADTSTAPQQSSQDTSAGMAISVVKIDLTDIYGTYNDEPLGIDAMISLGNLIVEMDDMDLETLKFHVDEMALKNTVARVKITKEPPPSEEDTTSSPFPDLALNRLRLANIDAKYENTVSSQKMDIILGELITTSENLDIANGKYELGEVSLVNTNAWISIGTSETGTDSALVDTTTEAGETIPLVASLEKLYLDNNNVRFDNISEAPVASGMDFNHLFFKDIHIDIRDIFYSKTDMHASVHQIQATEKSGFALKNFNVEINVDSATASLEGLDLETGQSELHHDLLLKYESLAAISENPGDLYLEATLENSRVAFSEILLFAPDLSTTPPFAGNRGQNVVFKGKMQGTVDDLSIENFALATALETRLAISGKIVGMPDMENSGFDLRLDEFHSTRRDIQMLVPDTLLSGFRLPEVINLTARYTGSITDFDAEADLRTTFGNMTASLQMSPDQNNGKTNYSTKASVDDFDIGRLLMQDSILGAITIQASVEGNGLSLEEMEANLDLNVESAEVMQYTYKDLQLRGTLSEEQFTGVAQMQDSNLYFSFNGQVDINDSVPEADFKLVLEGANLKALKLTEQDIRLKATLEAKIDGTDLNDLQANLDLRDFLLIKDGKRYAVDSFLVVSLNEENKSDLQIQSNILDARFQGNLNLADLPAEMEAHFARYFTMAGDSIPENERLRPNDFNFEINIKDPSLLTEVLLPDLDNLDPGTISGKYDSETESLEFHLFLPQIVYSDIHLDSLEIDITSEGNALKYAMQLSQIYNPTLLVENPEVSGRLHQDSIFVNFSITEDNEFRKLELGGVAYSSDSNYRFRFLPGQVAFAGKDWSVSSDHYLQFGPSGFFASNVKLENNKRMLSINSPEENPRSPLNLAFRDFNLALFSQAVERDTNLVSGLLNGEVQFVNLTENPAFTADLDIRDFSFSGDTLGNVAVKANNRTEDQFDVNIGITGNQNDVQVAGIYNTASEAEALDFDVSINNLELNSIEGYSMGQLDSMSGSIKGEISVQGSATAPDIQGFVKFDRAAFRVAYTGAHYTIRDDRITVNNQGIVFNNLTIRDSENNTARINGNIRTTDFSDMDFGLDVKTNSFMVVNSTEEDNELFWGKVLLSSNVRIRGDMNRPVITASITLDNGSSFTMALPDEEPATVDREGVVEFTDFDDGLPGPLKVAEKRDTIRSVIQGIDLSADITLTKASEFKILTDKAAGNYLQARGDATLNYGMDPGGKITLTGRYEISEGAYQLTYYNFIKRKFEIEAGSSITWTGDLMDALIDLTAKNTVETSPANLLSDEIAGYSQEQENRFKQELPFIIVLNLDGKLMSPTVDFDIELPPEERGALGGIVQAKLARLNQPEEESQLNKQVFALLVLQRFIQEDPLATAGEGGGVQSAARQGVSQLLTQQLNKLSGKYIEGVDLTFGVESYQDYSSGTQEQRTELNIGLSKGFFNDRVEVNIGGNVDLEGEESRQNNLNNIAGDVDVEYKITPDGIYRLKGFRKTEYEGLLEGEVVETGVSLIFTRDYDKLKNLFRKKEARKEED